MRRDECQGEIAEKTIKFNGQDKKQQPTERAKEG